MAKENTVRVPEPEEGLQDVQPQAEEGRKGWFKRADVTRYIRYVLFFVAIGLVYIWNSHVADKQVRRENKLKKEVADAKAEYKTMHARLSAGTRKSAIQVQVDSLGLGSHSKNIYQLKRE